MGFPSVPNFVFSDSVTLYPTTYGKDVAGGKTTTNATAAGTYRCAVSAASANEQSQHSREAFVVSHVVTSKNKIGKYQDQLRWAETGSILTVVAIEPAGDATGRIWNHYCEEHPS